VFLIQDGHHMRPHIASAIRRGHAKGAILSPADLTPALLAETASAVHTAGGVLAVDPQAIAIAVLDANPKKLMQHGHIDAVGVRARDLSSADITALAQRSLELQRAVGSSVLIAPTVPISSPDERWAQIAQNLAVASIADRRGKRDEVPLFVSVAARSALLSDRALVDDLLDELTRYEVDGFYVLAEVDVSRDLGAAHAAAEGTMHLVSALSQEADYRVWVGYAGKTGVVLRAAGAEATAGGWFHKQQWWSPSHWESSTGGQAPVARLSLAPLLGALRWEPEVRRLLDLRRRDDGLVAEVLSGPGELAAALRAGSSAGAAPERPELVAQLLAVLSSLDAAIPDDVSRRALHVDELLREAGALQQRLRSLGLDLDEVRGGPRLVQVWSGALTATLRR